MIIRMAVNIGIGLGLNCMGRHRERYGILWDGMGWYGMVWDGMGWYGMVWEGMGCYDNERIGCMV
jgi:hypothetical protein